MSAAWFDRLSAGLSRTREQLSGQLNVLLRRGPDLDDEFWNDLEEALISADMGAPAVGEMVARLRDAATRQALPDAEAVLQHLAEEIAREVTLPEAVDFLDERPVTILVIGINGTGKTTTVGKLAKAAAEEGRSVLIGSADTYRAAAVEQLHVWADRASVPIVERERGTDPASVAFESVRAAHASGADLLLIDTAGRLHTSKDLMAELTKVKRIVERESKAPVRTLLVMDATTGQNGLTQAREFRDAVGVDGIVITKLDGTAKGGIAVAVSRDLGVPILRIGVGESADDLRPFNAAEFASALVGLS
ncbi:MAG: signal recognition particle-docking protein FtsY [Actinomycetota bacterium]|nr:MAG: fused signal recognition particle [Actinomycetota bacterium]MDP3629674.1 signal recognition particle-docking protein FtsY [Actinomycetota bacterium]